MSPKIKAGDLVMVIRGHCSDFNVGRVFVATNVRPCKNGSAKCKTCGVRWEYTGLVVDGEDNCFPIGRLQKINPPAIKTETRAEPVPA